MGAVATTRRLEEATGSKDPENLPELVPLGQEALKHLDGNREWLSEVEKTKAALDAEPKEPFFAPQRKAKPGQPPLPPIHVQINDYTYKVPRGEMVHLPAEVCRILREAGYHELS